MTGRPATAPCLDCREPRPLTDLRPVTLDPEIQIADDEPTLVCRDREACRQRRVERVRRDEY